MIKLKNLYIFKKNKMFKLINLKICPISKFQKYITAHNRLLFNKQSLALFRLKLD